MYVHGSMSPWVNFEHIELLTQLKIYKLYAGFKYGSCMHKEMSLFWEVQFEKKSYKKTIFFKKNNDNQIMNKKAGTIRMTVFNYSLANIKPICYGGWGLRRGYYNHRICLITYLNVYLSQSWFPSEPIRTWRAILFFVLLFNCN